MSEPEELLLRVRATREERAALRSALLAARASELAELQRRGGRLAFGYGAESTRDAMGSEVDRLRLRHEMLDRLLAALEAAPALPSDEVDTAVARRAIDQNDRADAGGS